MRNFIIYFVFVILSLPKMIFASTCYVDDLENPFECFFYRIEVGVVKVNGHDSEQWDLGYSLGLKIYSNLSEYLFLGMSINYSEVELNENEALKSYPGEENLQLEGNYRLLEIGPYLKVYFSKRSIDKNVRFFSQFGVKLYYSRIEVNRNGYISSSYINDSNVVEEKNPGISAGIGVVIGGNSDFLLEIFPQYKLILFKDRANDYISMNIGLLF